MYFWVYGVKKTWLDKCLKSLDSEDPSKSDMVNGPKRYWNLTDTTFSIFIDPCEEYYSWKSLSEGYAKS